MEAYFAVIILVMPTAIYVAVGYVLYFRSNTYYNTHIIISISRYIIFYMKARRAKKQSDAADKTMAKDDDKDFEEPRKSIDVDYMSTQDMRST